MSHLLVTNDFPPRVGGIQSYLYELWRRLPAADTTVLTTAFDGAASWDAAQAFRVERVAESFLAPIPKTIARIDALAAEVDAELVLLDPAWPLGAIGPHLERPFGVVLHGAEVTIPARIPFVQLALRRTLRQAQLVVAAGGYPASEGRGAAGRAIDAVVVPPGVDTERFGLASAEQRAAVRSEHGIDADALVVLGVSRLVPRKGFDVLLQAAARLADHVPELKVVIAGSGRDHDRLQALAVSLSAPVQFLGEVDDEQLPGIYGCADIFAMVCRDRWLGLEQEGFGIVFLEAAACGLPAIAGRSGGSAEAVVDGVTGLVIDDPTSVDDVEDALAQLIDDPGRRARLGAAARQRATSEFSYDTLALSLREAIDGVVRAQREARAETQAQNDDAQAATIVPSASSADLEQLG
jgi:phosphatidylinositol alpha-1,6-mannosyltransferase